MTLSRCWRRGRLAKVDSKRFAVTAWNDSSTGWADFVFRYADFIMRDESGSYILITHDERFHFGTAFFDVGRQVCAGFDSFRMAFIVAFEFVND
jgi:hypothetical protein